MGQSQSTNNSRRISAVSVSSDNGSTMSGNAGGGGNKRYGREHKRHGVVTLKMANLTPNRRSDQITHTITPKGCILYGASMFNPAVIQNGMFVCCRICVLLCMCG